MAADSMLTLSPLPVPGPASAPSPSPAPAAAASNASAGSQPPALSSGGGHSRPAGANSSTPQAAQHAPRGASKANRLGGGSSDSKSPDSKSSGSKSANSTSAKSAGSKPPAKPSATQSGKATDSRSGQQAARASAAASISSTKTTTTPIPVIDDFSAALAQSLAATPSNAAAPADTPATQTSANSDTDEAGEPPVKHAASDPVSSALTLLENALAGALAGVIAGVPPAAASSTSAVSADSSSATPGSVPSATSTGTAAVLTNLLAQNLTADPQAGGSSSAPHSGTSSATTPLPAAIAAPAALAAAQLIAPTHVAAPLARTDAPTMALSSPVGTSAWTDELGARITWMAHQGIESASLQLSPEHLGPVQVSISVHEGQASVWFGAVQPDTRTALQQSLPQLRQLFASQGLSLADAGVSRESPRGQSRQPSARTAAPVAGVAAVSGDGAGGGRVSVAGLGLVDTYA